MGSLFRALLVALFLSGGWGGPCHARSLSGTLDQLVTFGDAVVPSNVIRAGVRIQESAVRSSDFAAAATTAGFFYRFDPEIGAAERVLSSRGPVFVETADTIGKRRVDVGFTYLYADLTDLDGDSLTDALNELTFLEGGAPDDTLFVVDADNFSLVSQVFSGSLTYGVTDRWDVNVLVPLILTSMNLRARSTLLVDFESLRNDVDSEQQKFGFGDVLLRTKYRLPDLWGVGIAPLLTLKLPTGNEDNFQGLGDVILIPGVAATRFVGPHDIHVSVGVETNTDDLDRSRIRYAGGVTLRLLDPLTFIVDMLGSSGFASASFTRQGVSGSVQRTDVIDIYTGFKVEVLPQFLVHGGFLVPVTDDGLRAKVVPALGLIANF
jgi:hypothetical protein